MTENVDETISTNQTLDLTYFITNEEELKYSEEINFNDAESNGEIKYTEGTLWTPDETGTYTIEIGDKELSIKVIDVPDSVDDYEWGGPVSERYNPVNSSTVDGFEINQNNPVFNGSYSLKFTEKDNSSDAISYPGDGLDYYPDLGDLIFCRVEVTDSDTSPRVGFFINEGDRITTNNDLVLYFDRDDGDFRIEMNGNSQASTSINWSGDKFYFAELHTEHDEDNDELDIRAILYDGPTDESTEIANLTHTATASDLDGQRGVSYAEYRNEGDFVIDEVLAKPGEGEPNI